MLMVRLGCQWEIISTGPWLSALCEGTHLIRHEPFHLNVSNLSSQPFPRLAYNRCLCKIYLEIDVKNWPLWPKRSLLALLTQSINQKSIVLCEVCFPAIKSEDQTSSIINLILYQEINYQISKVCIKEAILFWTTSEIHNIFKTFLRCLSANTDLTLQCTNF